MGVAYPEGVQAQCNAPGSEIPPKDQCTEDIRKLKSDMVAAEQKIRLLQGKLQLNTLSDEDRKRKSEKLKRMELRLSKLQGDHSQYVKDAEIQRLKQECRERDNKIDGLLDWLNDLKDVMDCPIQSEMLKNSVICDDGYSYIESAITEWFQKNDTSPMTNKLMSKTTRPNYTLSSIIEKWEEKPEWIATKLENYYD